MPGALLQDATQLAHAMVQGGERASVARAVFTCDSFLILMTWRLRCTARRWHVPGLNHLLRRFQTVFFGIEIGNEVTLGRGIYFVHPVGVVVGGAARVGARVRFMGGNTVGTARGDGHPVIEDDVVIGCGARVLGAVRVGARAVVGANAVVLTDVPPDSVAVGVPARVGAPPSGETVRWAHGS